MILYLASPYSHPEQHVRELRFREACEAAAILMKKGWVVFSPIAHSHPVSVHGHLDGLDHEFWLRQDFALLDCADTLAVLCLDGWAQSKGTRAEINHATIRGIPVIYLTPKGIDQWPTP
jgi:nucleoside 2-deoxyribosyltransferase